MKAINNFERLIQTAEIESEGGADYVIANDTTEDDFYFRYDFETEKVDFENSSKHELTGGQVDELIELMREKYKEDIELTANDNTTGFNDPDYYDEYGVDNAMFI